MKNIILIISSMMFFLTINTKIHGQEDLKNAYNAFVEENYSNAISLCKADKNKFPFKNILRDNLCTHAQRCFVLYTKNDCASLEKIKTIRVNSYKLTIHPQTDKKIEAFCKNVKPEYKRYLFDNLDLRNTIPETGIRQNIIINTNSLLSEFNRAYFNGNKINIDAENVTPKAKANLLSLWQSSRFYITDSLERIPKHAKITNTGWEIRNIPVFFEKGGTSEIVIEYTKDGKISNITEILPKHLFKPENITEKRSHPLNDSIQFDMIKRFLEDFRSAYCNKDIDFIESVFSEYALIIVGKELIINNKRHYTQTRKDKKTYITDLKKAFDKNQYVNVWFDDVKILRDKKDHNVYGITIRQRWFSSSYNDMGWLFLKIDFNEAVPQVWVRTWQPLSTPEDVVYGLSNFL